MADHPEPNKHAPTGEIKSSQPPDQLAVPGNRIAGRTPRGSLVATVTAYVIAELRPLPQPRVAVDFHCMSAAERSIEAMRYSFALLEYRMGRNGWICAWAISTLRVFFVVIPLIGVLLIVWLCVPLASGLAGIFQSLEVATKSLFWSTVYIILSMVVIASMIAILGTVVRLLRR